MNLGAGFDSHLAICDGIFVRVDVVVADVLLSRVSTSGSREVVLVSFETSFGLVPHRGWLPSRKIDGREMEEAKNQTKSNQIKSVLKS